MEKLLEKINLRYVIFALGGLLAAGLITLAVLLMLPKPQPAPAYDGPPSGAEFLEENPFGPEDFALSEDGFLSCLAAESVLGIDVSAYQGEIDWSAVKNAGVEFVFIRVGGRGTTEGGLYTDDCAQRYYEGAKQAGLQVGAYFFSQAITPEEAAEEAQFTLEQIRGWTLELPVVYDWEWVSEDSRTANMDQATLTQCTKVFCQQIEDAGLEAAVYFNHSQGTQLLDLRELTDYSFWLARYETSPDFPCRVDYWQYSCTGTVPGIETDVDLNLFFPVS